MSQFEIIYNNSNSHARCGELHTSHGIINTPVFMPVGTQATVKSLSSDDLYELKSDIILSNTYHLNDRPGTELIYNHGGLHKFMSWNKAILTDSGGYQIFSLAELNKITDKGVFFKSHSDGRECFIGPNESMQIQKKLGSDIIMTFDECPPYPAKKTYISSAVERTLKWSSICRDIITTDHNLFGIVQGGVFSDFREKCAKSLVEMDFDGYAIGGVSVGEPNELILKGVNDSIKFLPKDKPRYLMGVGEMSQMIDAIHLGVDMFDCIMPTRQARNGTVSTIKGRYPVKASIYKYDQKPLEENCTCKVCKKYSRSYIRHLLNVGEILGLRLITYHNIHCYLQFMRDIRLSIKEKRFNEFRRDFHDNYNLVSKEHLENIKE